LKQKQTIFKDLNLDDIRLISLENLKNVKRGKRGKFPRQLPTSEECGLVTTISGATFGSLTESLPLTDLLKVAIFLV
jgi:hypothetical protein